MKKKSLPKIIDDHKHKFPLFWLESYDFRHSAHGKSMNYMHCGVATSTFSQQKYNLEKYKNKIEISVT